VLLFTKERWHQSARAIARRMPCLKIKDKNLSVAQPKASTISIKVFWGFGGTTNKKNRRFFSKPPKLEHYCIALVIACSITD
ncbi:MAG: hypothetical protein R3Y49_07215, partial [Rikenellaceae bacterium]